jgi:Flp pilus assembly protein TadD
MAKGQDAEVAKELRSEVLNGIEVERLLAKAQVAAYGSDDPEKVVALGSTSVEGRTLARALLQQASTLDDNNAEVWKMYGALSSGERDGRTSEHYYRKAIALNPDDPYAHYGLGMARHLQEDLNGAEQSFKTAIRLKPNLAVSYNMLGSIQLDRGDYEGAASGFREAVRLKPEEGIFRTNLGAALRLQGKEQDALREYEEACRLGRQNGCQWAQFIRSGCASLYAAANRSEIPDGSGRRVDVTLVALAGSPLLLLRRRRR